MFVYRLSEGNLINDYNNFQKCCDIGFGTLNRHELCKQNALGNQMPLHNKKNSLKQ